MSCSFFLFYVFTQGQVFSGADYRVYLLGNPVCAVEVRFINARHMCLAKPC